MSLHVSVHAMPPGPWPTRSIEFLGVPFAVLDLPPGSLSSPLGVSFESVGEQLASQPRCFFEPDGSFTWPGETDGVAWQIDGMLFDLAGAIRYVELKLSGQGAPLDFVLSSLGWPAAPLAFTLVREGVALAEPEFRRYAASLPAMPLSVGRDAP